MKKLFFVTAFLFVFISNTYSQEIKFGVKAGVNFATIGGRLGSQNSGVTGLHIGGLAEISLFDKFSLQPEILYSTQGASRDTRSTDGPLYETELNYILVPISAKYNFVKGLSGMTGPQFGYLLSGKNKITPSGFGGNTDTSEIDIKDKLNSFEFAWTLGAEYRFNFGFFVQARYFIGLTSLTNNARDAGLGTTFLNDDTRNNKVFQVSVGYSF